MLFRSVEAATDRIMKEAEDYIAKIDALGGAAKAIEKGYIQQEIMDSAYRHQKAVESKDRIVVGVNQFQVKEEAPKGLLRVDPAVEVMQKQKIADLKVARDNAKVEETLAALRSACGTDENLMPYILEAVRAYATLGEVCQVMRDEFGEYIAAAML